MFTDDKITEIFVMCDEFCQKFDEFFKKLHLRLQIPASASITVPPGCATRRS